MAENAAQLYQEAQEILDDMLQTEISTWAQGILRQRIINDIYNAYTPKQNGWVSGMITGFNKPMWGRARATYQRRYDLPKMVYAQLESSGVLFVTSAAQKRPSIYNSKRYPAHPGEFLELLEGDSSKPHGGLGVWARGFPRPAVSIAQYIINKNLPHVVNTLIPKYFGH